MKTAILAVTQKGQTTAHRIAEALTGAEVVPLVHGVRHTLEGVWSRYDSIVCIMAAGIVVRCLGGLCQTKYRDPGVVVVDENGSFAVSLLSGHVGGANELAKKLADILDGTAVITTGSDVSGQTSIDLWSIENNLCIANPEVLARVSAHLLNHGTVRLFQEREYIRDLPMDFVSSTSSTEAEITIGMNTAVVSSGLNLIPRIRILGCGCRRGTPLDELQAALDDLEKHEGIDPRSIAGLASLDLKKDEPALIDMAAQHGWSLFFYSKDELSSMETVTKSTKVFEKVGVYSVCEAAALKAAERNRPGRLIVRKIKWKRITMAVAEVAF